MIEIQNVYKKYDDGWVLNNLNNVINKGEFVTIVGSSGCGKSTFLKMILGIEDISQGTISLDNKPLKNEPDAERGIVFQHYSVFPHMTVLNNVISAFSFKTHNPLGFVIGKKYRLAKEQAIAILDEVGLGESLNKYPHELSGGMQQRLALAQALLGNPKILLLDEPFGALDPGIRADMHQLVIRLYKQHNLTIFMVTHDLEEGFRLGTRMWVMGKDTDPQQGAYIKYDVPLKNDLPAVQNPQQMYNTIHDFMMGK